MRAFADTGAPPAVDDDPGLRALADAHVVVLDRGARIVMAHPFAAHTEGARVRSGHRTWWGNCAWDALGIVAALRLPHAEVRSGDVTVCVDDGRIGSDSVFHVAVAARHWWDDIAFT